jgi:hypothetical protein
MFLDPFPWYYSGCRAFKDGRKQPVLSVQNFEEIICD